ncbi:MAG: hypothetical protein AB1428_02815 [Bacteroidota bacterium]
MKRLEYRYRVGDLHAGSSLGNRFLFAQLDAHTNLRGLWCSLDNRFYAGEWLVDISVDDDRLEATETIFAPESQTTALHGVRSSARRRFFLPFSSDKDSIDPVELLAGIFIISLNNDGPRELTFSVRHVLTFPAVPSDHFTKKPPAADQQTKVGTCIRGLEWDIVTTDRMNEARCFRGVSVPSTWSADDRTLAVEYHYVVPPGRTFEAPFLLAVSPSGAAGAAETAARLGDVPALLLRSVEHYEELLSRTRIVTPEPAINRGLQWAKVNIARVQHRFRAGDGFTNDPPQDIVVIRDVGWYVFGSDYLTPQFSRAMLNMVSVHAVHERGKLTEYIHANEESPQLHDYNLNINDDTPLFIVALVHHAAVSGDVAFLRAKYAVMKDAGEWIIAQIRDGLVRCDATGTNVWGICSWRNIIDGYTLSGAVTEINAECAFALSLLASAASMLGLQADAERYDTRAKELARAINDRLVSETTGMYLLNIDTDGVRHHDVTGDLIFPVLFGIAPPERKRKILETLTGPEFWTPYGSRTVSPREEKYDPDAGYQLMGGVWPNLTAWAGYCIRGDNPGKLAEAMVNTYRLSEIRRPLEFVNVVPGEFPERLHGESFVSRGMTMSPWMPPTYLWLGVEGLLGVTADLGELRISPAIPPHWLWIAVQDLLVGGERLNAFFYDGVLYSSRRIGSAFPVRVGVSVPVRVDHDALCAIALANGKEITLFVAAEDDAEGNVTLHAGAVEIAKRVQLTAGDAVLFRIPATGGEASPRIHSTVTQ